MRPKLLILIFALFLLIPIVYSVGFSEYPTLFRDTFDSSTNLSLTGCTVSGGKLTCNDAAQAIYIHKLPNQTTNSVNWSITLVGIEFQQLDTDYAFRTVEENSTSATIAWAIGVTGATDALLGVDPADTRVDVFLVASKPFNFTFLHMPNGTIFMYVNQSNETMEANASGTNALDNEGVYMYWGATITQGYQYTVEEFIVRNHTLAQAEADTTPPLIDQNSYNMTSEGGAGCINWRTDKTNPCSTGDTTPTINFTTDEGAWCAIGKQDINFTDYNNLGVDRNCTLGQGTTSHTCTLKYVDELVYEDSSVYISCQDSSKNENRTSSSGTLILRITGLETGGEAAIGVGVQNALLSSYTNYTNQQIYARKLDGTQDYGTFDWVAKKGSKIWAFNLITKGESHVGLFNMTPVLYVLEMANVTNSTIINTVELMINATK